MNLVLAAVLVATIAGVDAAGLDDRTYMWVDVSLGVAGSVAFCVVFVGIVFAIYDFNFRDYASEVRPDGSPFTPMYDDSKATPGWSIASPPVISAEVPSSISKAFDGNGEVAGLELNEGATTSVVTTERYITRSSQIDMPEVDFQMN